MRAILRRSAGRSRLAHHSALVMLWLGVWALVGIPESCPGLVIYRLGGEDLPAPVEAASAGVDFVQLPWETAAAAGGEEFQVEFEGGILRPLRYNRDVNIAPGWDERGGALSPPSHFTAFDGDPSTPWLVPQYICAEFLQRTCTNDYAGAGTVQLRLGAIVPVDRVVVHTGSGVPGTSVRNVRVHVAPAPPPGNWLTVGAGGMGGLPPQNPHVEVRDNREDSVVVELPPQQVGFLQVAVGEHNTPWIIGEIELFARGFVEQASYVSNRVDLGEPAAWGDLRWTGSIDPDAQVLIRTRSGADEDPTLFWQRTGRGDQRVEVTRAQYNGLARGEKGGTTDDLDNWSSWSPPYDFAESAGTAITSRGPRRYLQFMVDLRGGGDAGGRVDFLELHASAPPAASELLGEIAPIVADLGEATQFTYTLTPFIGTRSNGFDHLELTASAARFLSIETVRINEEEVPFTPALEDHRLRVGFRPLERRDSGISVEVVFNAAVFRFGTAFNARVFNSAEPLEVPQRVSPGNATDAVEGDRVTVETTAERAALLGVTASPGTFTPNGDGVNDTVRLVYDIYEATHAVAVDIEIRDLGGALVRSYPGMGEVGRHMQSWDGRDALGRVVPPGVYVHRVVVHADEEQGERIGTTCVAY